MPSSVTSLFWISLCGVVAPLVAGMVPRRLLPEVVLLLAFGVVIGPHTLSLASADEAISLLSNFGLGMLFLLAGYEIDPEELAGHRGRRALATWCGCLALALLLVWLAGLTGAINSEVAVAIALTSTALGTLLPILKDNALLGTPLGVTVLSHGAFGELGPIVAMAVLLGVRGPVLSMLILLGFGIVTAAFSLVTVRLRREGSQLLHIIRAGAETTGQTTVRLTVLLLVSLAAIASIADLDAVLGAFAAGLVLRFALPSGEIGLEAKLEGLSFGFAIPVFFVTSGMAINPRAVASEPLALVIFVLSILLIRGGPVFLVVRAQRDPQSGGRLLDDAECVATALFASTGLPIIVAVTAVAVASGQMTSTNASVLVAGGALTVLLFPVLARMLIPATEPSGT